MSAALAPFALPLLGLALRASLLLSLTFLVDRGLRRAPAAARHGLWVVAFGGLALLPILTTTLPEVAIPLLPAGGDGVHGLMAAGPVADRGVSRADSTSGGTTFTAGAAGVRTAAQLPARTGSGANESLGLVTVAATTSVAVAAGGTLFLLLYLQLGLLRAGRWVRHAVPLADHPRWRPLLDDAVRVQGLRRRPALAISESVSVPVLCGVLRPTILLPPDAEAWSDVERRRVLAHEVAHAARRDGLTQVAARVVAALYWWHPLVWRSISRLVLVAELACDDRVLAGGGRGADYARQLLDLARRNRPARRVSPRPVVVAMARRHQLAVRIGALLDEARPAGPSPRAAMIVALGGLLAVTVASAPVRLVAAPTDPAVRVTGEGADTSRANGWHSSGGVLDRDWVRESIARQRDRMTPLMGAVFDGDRIAVRRLLAAGADPDEAVRGLGTPLILAADAGDPAIVELLLAHRADPNRAETGGERPGDLQRTPLGSAARAGELATVELLLAAGAEVDAAPQGDATPLMTAARHGHLPLVERFLAAGADVDARIVGDGTPLIEAAREGHLAIVELLLAAGAPPDTAVVGDGNPLVMAAAEGHREVFERLLEAGADPDVWVPGDESALYHAVERGDAWMVERLIAAGADVSGSWPEEEGPLSLAGSRRVAELLRQAGARR